MKDIDKFLPFALGLMLDIVSGCHDLHLVRLMTSAQGAAYDCATY